MFIRRKTLEGLLVKLEGLENGRHKDKNKFKALAEANQKSVGKINKIEDAISLEPTNFATPLLRYYFSTIEKKRPRNRITILEEKVEALAKLAEVELIEESAKSKMFITKPIKKEKSNAHK